MNHCDHTTLPGYDPRQIWCDGCHWCEELNGTLPVSIGSLDDVHLARAIKRARCWFLREVSNLGPIAENEKRLLQFLAPIAALEPRLRRAWRLAKVPA